jgi:hypothetical protein
MTQAAVPRTEGPTNTASETEDLPMQRDLPTVECQFVPWFRMMNVQMLILLEYGFNDIFCNLGKECNI